MTYPDTPGFKVDGASKIAAESMQDKAPTIRDKVLALFKRHGWLTADECADKLGLSVLSVRPRLSELLRQGKLTKSDRLKQGRYGAPQHFYVLVP